MYKPKMTSSKMFLVKVSLVTEMEDCEVIKSDGLQSRMKTV